MYNTKIHSRRNYPQNYRIHRVSSLLNQYFGLVLQEKFDYKLPINFSHKNHNPKQINERKSCLAIGSSSYECSEYIHPWNNVYLPSHIKPINYLQYKVNKLKWKSVAIACYFHAGFYNFLMLIANDVLMKN